MKLLIVDDDIPTTQAVRNCVLAMSELTFDVVETAYNVVTAKEMIQEEQYDIVICDIEMPRYSGMDLLEWVREQGGTEEFIFLTCHESFHYAAQAIRYKAEAYIIKPVDYETLKDTLIQTVKKLIQQSEQTRWSVYGTLWLEHSERIENTLWREILFADTVIGLKIDKPREEHIKANIRFDIEYQLVLCVVLNTNFTQNQWDAPTFRCAAGNVVGEILFGTPSLARVFDYSRNGRVYVAAIVDAAQENSARCERLVQVCRETLRCKMTVYLGRPCSIAQLWERRLFWEQMDLDNVTRTMSVVQSEAQILPQEESITLDTAQFAETLRQGRAVEAVDMIRHILDTAEYGGLISAQALHSVRQDVMQILFAYLMQEHILAHELFEDRNAKQLEATCSNSVFDMLKWVDYIVKRAIDMVAQARQGECVVEKVKRYIEENCCKDVTREEVGRYVFLSPGYVARLFKQETGRSLRDYVNECRITRAKQMLAAGGRNVSEIAASVGFDNFSYFSTLFKKYVDCPPSEYMRKNE